MRASKPVTVTLGDLQDRVEARVKSGSYASVSDVVRAALLASRYGRNPASACLARRFCSHRVRPSAVPITRAETAVVTVPRA